MKAPDRAVALLALMLSASWCNGASETPEQELARLRAENKQLRAQLAAQTKLLPKPSTAAAPTETISHTEVAAVTAPPPAIRSFFSRLYLRKSAFREDVVQPGSISAPAEISYSHAGHGGDSYAIDAGLAASLTTVALGSAQIDWGPGLDYHRNTAAGSRKDLLQTGLFADAVLGNATRDTFFALAKAHLTYKDDELHDTDGIAGGIDLLPVTRALLIDNYQDVGPVRWRWQPFLGLRWDDRSSGGHAASGDRVLGRYGVETEIYPLYRHIRKSLELVVIATGWSRLTSSGGFRDKDWRGYLDANLTYWFNGGATSSKTKANLGFGVSYENGDDADTDSDGIDLLSVSLKAKF